MLTQSRPIIAVIGAGPAGLMAAETAARHGAAVTVYDRMPSAGRKFLMAGRGGLNLTHSEPLDRFLSRYEPVHPLLRRAVDAFPPQATRDWADALGQSTFVGSSGRVFPTAFKASPLLRAWLTRLADQGVVLKTRHHWTGWDAAGRLSFETPDGVVAVEADGAIVALGGASWPRLGGDGDWVAPLARAGLAVAPLQPANCGFVVGWSEHLRGRCAGQPLKRIALSFGGRSVRGEAMIADYGLEGGAIYALSRPLREAIAASGEAVLAIDLRPDLAVETLAQKLATPRGKRSLANHLRKAADLSSVAVALLQEAAIRSGEQLANLDPATLAARIKAVPVRLTAPTPLARAISSAGGLSFDELDDRFMLRGKPGVFVCGEMLDWEAPTGGYLLQACLATGVSAGEGAMAWLAERGAA